MGMEAAGMGVANWHIYGDCLVWSARRGKHSPQIVSRLGAFSLIRSAVRECERRPAELDTQCLSLDRGTLLRHLSEPLYRFMDCLLQNGSTPTLGTNPCPNCGRNWDPRSSLCHYRKAFDPSWDPYSKAYSRKF